MSRPMTTHPGNKNCGCCRVTQATSPILAFEATYSVYMIGIVEHVIITEICSMMTIRITFIVNNIDISVEVSFLCGSNHISRIDLWEHNFSIVSI